MIEESQPLPPRPLGLTIVGWLLILSGVSMAESMVLDFINGRININFGVLVLPVGLGLLKGRASSITWARFWIGFLIFGCSLILLAYPFSGKSMHVRLFSTEVQGLARQVIGLTLPSFLIALGVWSWRVLGSPETQQFMASRDSTLGRPQP